LDLGELLKEESLAINMDNECQDGIPSPTSVLTDAELERIMDRSNAAYEEVFVADDHFALVANETTGDVLANLN
jgi:hypothetical protein